MLVEKLGIEASQITPTANFIRDLGIDSLDYIELIMEFEQAFDILIPTRRASNSRPWAKRWTTSKANWQTPERSTISCQIK